MSNEQDLQDQVAFWNEQAAAGDIPYHELEARIYQAAEALKKEFDEERLTQDEYKARRKLLVLKDAAGQRWRLLVDGTWRQQTPQGEWRLPGEPYIPRPTPPPPPEPEKRKPGAVIVAFVAAIVLLAVCGLLVSIFSISGPTPTPTYPPLPSIPSTQAKVPTDTPSPLTSTPIPTPTPGITPPTDTPSPTAKPTSTPGVTLSAPTFSPPATNTPFPPPATATPTPSPTPTPYGVIAYAAFDDIVADTYNIYLRAWPDLKVIQTVPKAGQPAVSRDGHLLAYRSWDTNHQGILTINLQSQEVSPDVIGPLEAMHPAWSPAGRLVFTANNGPDQKWRLYLSGRSLPIDGSMEGPAWVNDSRLAFHGCVVAGCGLFTANIDGSDLRRLTDNGHDRNPAPSPSGERLAFMSDRAGNWDIYLIAADGFQAAPTRLTNDPATDGLPTWSPDGRWIAFVSERGGKWAMWMMPAEGGEPRRLFDMEGSPHGSMIDGTPSQAGWLQEQVSWFVKF
jgi:hypothetical protein